MKWIIWLFYRSEFKPSKERVETCKEYIICREITTVLTIAVDNPILKLCDSCDFFPSPLIKWCGVYSTTLKYFLELIKLPISGANTYVQSLLKFPTWGSHRHSKSTPHPIVPLPPLGITLIGWQPLNRTKVAGCSLVNHRMVAKHLVNRYMIIGVVATHPTSDGATPACHTWIDISLRWGQGHLENSGFRNKTKPVVTRLHNYVFPSLLLASNMYTTVYNVMYLLHVFIGWQGWLCLLWYARVVTLIAFMTLSWKPTLW